MSCSTLNNPRMQLPVPRRMMPALLNMTGLLMAALHGSSVAGVSEMDELARDQISVRELMRLETAQALQRLRAERQTRAGLAEQRTISTVGSSLSEAQLVGIYGVGRKLMAEVRVGERTLLFMRGRLQAVGPEKNHAVRLLDITDRCVELQWDGQRQSLCAASGGVARN